MRRLPLVVLAASVAAMVGALVIPQTVYNQRAITWLFSVFSAAYVGVGALVAARRPANRLGWLMLAIGAVSSLSELLGAYGGYVLAGHPDQPLALAAAWVTTWSYWSMLAGIVLMVLIFPTGILGTGVRRWTAWTCLVSMIVLSLVVALTPGRLDGFGRVQNPYGLLGLTSQLKAVSTVAALVLAGTFLVALGSVFLRRRRATGLERGQLSWLAYATVLMVVSQAINTPLSGIEDTSVALLSVVVAIAAFPAAVAIAILRYRLYDIDRLISRTLVYGALTATLLATYLVSVLLFRVLLDPVTGTSDLAVAGSTLAVAALFRPVRGRIQAVVDQRFYRRRYDAARSVEAFSGRLRQEVDLDAVTTDLRGVVRDTVDPDHVSLWLRGSADGIVTDAPPAAVTIPGRPGPRKVSP